MLVIDCLGKLQARPHIQAYTNQSTNHSEIHQYLRNPATRAVPYGEWTVNASRRFTVTRAQLQDNNPFAKKLEDKNVFTQPRPHQSSSPRYTIIGLRIKSSRNFEDCVMFERYNNYVANICQYQKPKSTKYSMNHSNFEMEVVFQVQYIIITFTISRCERRHEIDRNCFGTHVI